MQLQAPTSGSFHSHLHHHQIFGDIPNFANALMEANAYLHQTLNQVQNSLDKIDGVYTLNEAQITEILSAYLHHYSYVQAIYDEVLIDDFLKDNI